METSAPKFEQKDIDDNKIIAALSYIGILVLIPLLARPDSKFCKAHAKQGLVLFIASVICGAIPVLGWLVALVLLLMAVVAIVKTLQGEFWKMPLFYDLSEKFNI